MIEQCWLIALSTRHSAKILETATGFPVASNDTAISRSGSAQLTLLINPK